MQEHRGESKFESDKWSERNHAQNQYEKAQKRGEDKRRKHNKIFAGHSELKSLYTSGGFLEEDAQQSKKIKVRIKRKKAPSEPLQNLDEIALQNMEKDNQNHHAAELYTVLRSRLNLLQKIDKEIEEKEIELERLKQQVKKMGTKSESPPCAPSSSKYQPTTADVLNIVRATVAASKGKPIDTKE